MLWTTLFVIAYQRYSPITVKLIKHFSDCFFFLSLSYFSSRERHKWRLWDLWLRINPKQVYFQKDFSNLDRNLDQTFKAFQFHGRTKPIQVYVNLTDTLNAKKVSKKLLFRTAQVLITLQRATNIFWNLIRQIYGYINSYWKPE